MKIFHKSSPLFQKPVQRFLKREPSCAYVLQYGVIFNAAEALYFFELLSLAGFFKVVVYRDQKINRREWQLTSPLLCCKMQYVTWAPRTNTFGSSFLTKATTPLWMPIKTAALSAPKHITFFQGMLYCFSTSSSSLNFLLLLRFPEEH